MADLGEAWVPTMSPQLRQVWAVVRDGEWHALADIAARSGVPESSASTRMRELRMERFGSWTVDRREHEERFEYRVGLPSATEVEPPQFALDLGLPPVAPDPGPVASTAPTRTFLGTTVAQARRWVKARLRDGDHCPVCEQRVQMYRRKITGSMVRALVLMARAGALSGWKHMPTVVGAARADEAKLAYWGLLEEEKTLRPDGGRAGYWRITERGRAFLAGDLEVPAYALVYNSQCMGLEGELVSAQACMGEPFDLAELLAG